MNLHNPLASILAMEANHNSEESSAEGDRNYVDIKTEKGSRTTVSIKEFGFLDPIRCNTINYQISINFNFNNASSSANKRREYITL